MKKTIIVLGLLSSALCVLQAAAPKTTIDKDKSSAVADTLQSGRSAYAKLIQGTKSTTGLFTIHKTKSGSYYFEIPDSLLGRDFLMASRVVNISDNAKISAGQRRSNPVLISFSRRDKMLFMHQPTGNSYTNPTDPISVSLANNNMIPVVMSLDIAARNDKNDASLVDVTKLYSSEVDLVFPTGAGGGGKLDSKASQILEMKSFSQNVEVKSFYNYSGGKEPFCITVNYSLVLLSKVPMRPRLNDERISFSSENKRKFESGKPCTGVKLIDRWRIEARPEDLEKHKHGELVVPQKQIVFYVDTVMPEKWRKYVRTGIETWNAAFEQIGFKQVIKAVDFPRNTNFDPDDIRNNCFRYITSTDANAQGPQWIDPRTCEIIQGDIMWWHNVIDLLQTWLFVQTGAVDSDARKKVLDDKLIGEAIRYAVSHEMGHVLGLQHNMRASFAYPTDSLRSATFTQQFGTTASIMDYARNNYVAQPGDKEKGVRLNPPVLGPYDYFSIKWGYKPIYEATTFEDESTALNKWFVEKGTDPVFFNGATIVSAIVPDPASQSDALGNDLLKSGAYGISNLKYITKNLIRWTMENGDDFELINKRFDGIKKLFFRLSNLPLSYLGGVYVLQGTYGQHSSNSTPVAKAQQKDAIRFVVNGLVDYKWLDNPELNKYIDSSHEEILKWQSTVIGHLLGNFILGRIVNSETLFAKSPYTLDEYLKDVDAQLWIATTKTKLSVNEKHIQLTYVDKLCGLVRSMMMTPKSDERSVSETVWASSAASQLVITRSRVVALLQKSALQDAGHYRLLLNIIDKVNK